MLYPNMGGFIKVWRIDESFDNSSTLYIFICFMYSADYYF